MRTPRKPMVQRKIDQAKRPPTPPRAHLAPPKGAASRTVPDPHNVVQWFRNNTATSFRASATVKEVASVPCALLGGTPGECGFLQFAGSLDRKVAGLLDGRQEVARPGHVGQAMARRPGDRDPHGGQGGAQGQDEGEEG